MSQAKATVGDEDENDADPRARGLHQEDGQVSRGTLLTDPTKKPEAPAWQLEPRPKVDPHEATCKANESEGALRDLQGEPVRVVDGQDARST